MRTIATQTDRSRNSATITSPNNVGIPLQKSQQQSQYPQKVSNLQYFSKQKPQAPQCVTKLGF